MANRTELLLLVSAIALAGCMSLPDEQLARDALARGDLDTAERNYQALADMGYVDAQIGIADLLVASGKPEDLARAEATYRRASKSPEIAVRLGKLLMEKPNPTEAELREAEQLLSSAFEAGNDGALTPLARLYLQYPRAFGNLDIQQKISEWRAAGYPQADLVQIKLYELNGTYDQHLADIEGICLRLLPQADSCYHDLAMVYQLRGDKDARSALVDQVMTSYRAGTASPARVESVASVLGNINVGEPDPETAKTMLEEIVADYPPAYLSMAALTDNFPALGDADSMMNYLRKAQEAGLPRAELLIGKMYYDGRWLPREPRMAEQHLLKAAQTERQAHYYLGLIYRRGYLGQVEPEKARDHLLQAARDGQAGADLALAQMYFQGRGIKPNPVYAYSFCQLAIKQGIPRAAEFKPLIEAQLTPAQRAAADQLMRQEEEARGGQWQARLQMQAMQDNHQERKTQ